MNRLVAPFLCVFVAACQVSVPPPLEGARIGGPFTLTDQNGQTRTDKDFVGKYRIMYFGYTYCPDVCPTDMARLSAGYRAFAQRDAARAARVVPIFVSVDPDRDKPAVLKAFVGAFDAHFVGLTGTPAQIAAVAKTFGILYQKEQSPGASGYLVDHSRIAYLFDPNGKPLALIPQDGKPDEIAGELAKWVR